MSAQAKITRVRQEARRYERSVPDLVLGVVKGQSRAEALTVSRSQSVGDVRAFEREPRVTPTVRRLRKDGEVAYRGTTRFTLTGDVDVTKRPRWADGVWQFDDETIGRLNLLAQQVLVEFGTINWDEQGPGR